MDGTVDTFSYAEPTDPRLKRFIIRMIERMTGQPYLKSLYDDRFARRMQGESFWDLAIRLLDLKIVTNEDALARIPKTGPLVVVANHPFGVLDGVIICHLVARVRSDFQILTNAVLNRADEVKEFLLPVDFTESEAALQTNLKSRAAAKGLLPVSAAWRITRRKMGHESRLLRRSLAARASASVGLSRDVIT